MMNAGYDINDLYREAQSRWLKPPEVLFILQNHEKYQLTEEAPKQPTSGSLFLFNKRVLRFFRRDGHSWRKKRDGRTVGEAHERLKVGNAEALNCYYAHGEYNPNFQRRSYWMLDQRSQDYFGPTQLKLYYQKFGLKGIKECFKTKLLLAPLNLISPISMPLLGALFPKLFKTSLYKTSTSIGMPSFFRSLDFVTA